MMMIHMCPVPFFSSIPTAAMISVAATTSTWFQRIIRVASL